ncbi:MAG: SusC/RagA family TonB-linked outer membrane protein [Prevotellaceae bacterium]|jgi:TonB-linked SusC/RagA family outer membrane protein|nr:SusC/RagA family TonB-linked outer membrane protein [Prevotellaceae bacterium]
MKKNRFFLTFLICLVAFPLFGQTIQVRGIVTDASDNAPLSGVFVLVKGTNTATSSLNDGSYVITAPANATLVFSFIGMNDVEVQVNGRTDIAVRMEPDETRLDEVIVVAFGTATKKAFTGSATVLSSDDITKHVSTNIANVLVGSVPGVQMRGSSGAPGAGSGSINIRGINSMYAGTDPLVIVDGAPYSASLSNIPQSDIESVTVLKDAASAALYGARGGAGVIIVTTKKGQAGKTTINADVRYGVNSRVVQEYETIKDPAAYYEAYYSQLYNFYKYGQKLDETMANINANTKMINDLGYNVYNVPQGQVLVGTNGKLNPNATLGRRYFYGGTEFYLQPDDWNKLAYKSALRQEYNVNLTGATDRSSFYSSIGYLNEGGIIDNANYDRLSARLKADYQVKSWLKVGGNVGYVHTNTESNPNMDTALGSTNLMYYTTMIAPIYPVYIRVIDEFGNVVIKKDVNGNDAYDYGVASTNYGLQRAFLQTGNPIGSNRYNKVNSIGDQMNASFTADISITKNLKAYVISTAILGLTNFSDYENPFYGPKVGINGSLDKRTTTGFRTNNTQTLTYFKDFGMHNINVMVGHDYYKESTKFLQTLAQGGFSPEIPEVNAFAKVTDGASYTSGYNVEGFLGSLQYNFTEKYFASLSFRRDASSRFLKEHRWGNFWAFGGAWLASREEFLRALTWIDMLKVKASIGQQGKDDIGNWGYTDLYSLSASSETTMSPSFNRIGNPDITWETTTNFNVGVEFSFFKERFAGSIEFYNKKISDLLFWLSVPESAGTRGYYGNIGDFSNTGIELSLAGAIVRTKNIDWRVMVNMTQNTDKILSLPESKITDNGGFVEGSRWLKVGGSFYNAFYRKYAGVNENGLATFWVDENVKNASNKPGTEYSYTTTIFSEASYYELGSLTPKVFGGFGTTLRVFDFDLSLTFDYQVGGKVFDTRYQRLMKPSETASDAGNNIHVDYIKSWSPTNTTSNIPRWQHGDQYAASGSDRFLTDASYLNFQSFTIGYTLPKNLINGISRLRIYAAGENLTFWSARQGFDPRHSFTSNTYVAVYSPVRNFSGGIQLTF